MKKTLRRQRTRRGLKRRVRKNKTMRGGLWWIPFTPSSKQIASSVKSGAESMLSDRFNPVSIETFKKTGYTFATQSLYRYLKNIDGIVENANEIKSGYSTFYNKNKNMMIDAYDPIKIGSDVTDKAKNAVSSLLGIEGAEKVVGSRPILSPSDFNDVLDKITTGWDSKQKVTTKLTNRKFIDFGLSYTKYMESVLPPQQTSSNQINATKLVEGVANKATNVATGFRSFFGSKSNI